jgi:hypothetical protein
MVLSIARKSSLQNGLAEAGGEQEVDCHQPLKLLHDVVAGCSLIKNLYAHSLDFRLFCSEVLGERKSGVVLLLTSKQYLHPLSNKLIL